jgi:hypothetical protein
MCEKVHEFADGELSPADTEAFQVHLPDCRPCERELENIFALKGLAETAALRAGAPATGELRQMRRSRTRRAWVLGGGAGLAVAAAAAVFLVPRLRPSPADRPWLALNENRALEPRLSDPRADRYGRHDQMRGAGDDRRPPDYIVLEELDKRGDVKGVVNRWLFLGEPGPARTLLESAQTANGFDDERAVLALLDGHPMQALALTSAVLARHPNAPQALWNRALALRDLHADRAAAAAFDAVASLGESGWSEDARLRATDLRSMADSRRKRWNDAERAVGRLVSDGVAPRDDIISNFPDLVRSRFYEAVSSAGSRAALDRLEPTAQALDAHYHEPGVLTGRLERVRRLDLRRRAPLAATYAELLAHDWRGSTPGAVADYVTALRKAGPLAGDLLLGVLLEAAATAQPGELERLAREQQDPWFDAAVVEATLGAGLIGDEQARHQRLASAAAEAARHHLEGAHWRLELYRAYLLVEQHRLPEAERVVTDALAAWQTAGLRAFQTQPLLQRAASYPDQSEVFKAYRDEVLAENAASPN